MIPLNTVLWILLLLVLVVIAVAFWMFYGNGGKANASNGSLREGFRNREKIEEYDPTKDETKPVKQSLPLDQKDTDTTIQIPLQKSDKPDTCDMYFVDTNNATMCEEGYYDMTTEQLLYLRDSDKTNQKTKAMIDIVLEDKKKNKDFKDANNRCKVTFNDFKYRKDWNPVTQKLDDYYVRNPGNLMCYQDVSSKYTAYDEDKLATPLFDVDYSKKLQPFSDKNDYSGVIFGKDVKYDSINQFLCNRQSAPKLPDNLLSKTYLGLQFNYPIPGGKGTKMDAHLYKIGNQNRMTQMPLDEKLKTVFFKEIYDKTAQAIKLVSNDVASMIYQFVMDTCDPPRIEKLISNKWMETIRLNFVPINYSEIIIDDQSSADRSYYLKGSYEDLVSLRNKKDAQYNDLKKKAGDLNKSISRYNNRLKNQAAQLEEEQNQAKNQGWISTSSVNFDIAANVIPSGTKVNSTAFNFKKGIKIYQTTIKNKGMFGIYDAATMTKMYQTNLADDTRVIINNDNVMTLPTDYIQCNTEECKTGVQKVVFVSFYIQTGPNMPENMYAPPGQYNINVDTNLYYDVYVNGKPIVYNYSSSYDRAIGTGSFVLPPNTFNNVVIRAVARPNSTGNTFSITWKNSTWNTEAYLSPNYIYYSEDSVVKEALSNSGNVVQAEGTADTSSTEIANKLEQAKLDYANSQASMDQLSIERNNLKSYIDRIEKARENSFQKAWRDVLDGNFLVQVSGKTWSEKLSLKNFISRDQRVYVEVLTASKNK